MPTTPTANSQASAPVLIAGGGIGGLSLALTLHQIGVRCRVLESVRELKPLGVGINLQPNAVRELLELGITRSQLDEVGLPIREWALVGLNGRDIYAEPRGEEAGYRWPQYAVHRGAFHGLLYRTVCERLGPAAVRLDQRVVQYANTVTGVDVVTQDRRGDHHHHSGCLLIGADGIHSRVRAQMHPSQPPIHWGGAILWRGTSRTRALRTGASFVGLGTHQQRMVIYPISHPDADGNALINWIAEITVDAEQGWQADSWFQAAAVSDFIDHFDAYRYPWLDVPTLLDGADCAYQNAMIDRDPVSTWVDGSVALIGDAAHAMYPTGSNGASQAIVDARVLGAACLEHGARAAALDAYNTALCGPISALVLRNRNAGPFGLLDLVDARCGGVFDDIDAVVPLAEREAFMAQYKASAGFAMDALNAAPSTIPAAQLPGDA
ncbi:MAG: flavin-dependent oxidoreductase [Pseudomonadota bacterium]